MSKNLLTKWRPKNFKSFQMWQTNALLKRDKLYPKQMNSTEILGKLSRESINWALDVSEP